MRVEIVNSLFLQEGGEQRQGARYATPAGEEADDAEEDEHGGRPRLELLGERGAARSGREPGGLKIPLTC